MRAVICRQLGPLDNVVVEERPTPRPGPGELVIDVRASGVNFVDGLICQGRYQMRPTAPYVPGGEIAGVVAEVGKGVTEGSVGDRVMAMTGWGAFAEHVSVRAESVAVIPEAMSFAQAAAFIQSYSTAWFSLARRAALGEDEWCLVLGAGGGIGLAACDVALALGAKVIAAASSEERLEGPRALGVHGWITYEEHDVKTAARKISGGGVDVVVDPVGGRQSEPALRALRPFGRFCVVGFAAGSIASIPLNQILLNNRTVIGVDWGAWAFQNMGHNREMLAELLDIVRAGRLRPTVPAERPLAEAREVMEGLLERRLTGKFVLVP
ncbi:MAG: NADPH:quinone oxidoreductase family protein [Acidimicrobiales bacterium]